MSYDSLSDRTAGISGADIANIVNQSKINAIQTNNKIISIKNLEQSIDEVIIGREKRERILSKKELKRVSYHEAGHCLMGFILKHSDPPIKVSIIPRGESALGYSQNKPSNNKLLSENEILSKIGVLLGGRCAEQIIYNNISTGAYDDIEKISILVKKYTIYWGMNKKIGPLNVEAMGSYLTNNLSNEIFNECKKIINKIELQVNKILSDNKNNIIKIGKELLKYETINYNKIKQILPNELENSLSINLE